MVICPAARPHGRIILGHAAEAYRVWASMGLRLRIGNVGQSMKRVIQATFLAWSNNFIVGILFFALSSMAVPISQDMQLSQGQMGLLFALPCIIIACGGGLPGLLVDRLGPGSIWISFGLTWLGAMGLVFCRSWATLLLLVLLESMGITLGMPASNAIIKRLGRKDYEKLLGIVGTGMSIGTWATHSSALRLLAHWGDWRWVLLLFGGVTLALGAINLLLWRRNPLWGEATVPTPAKQDCRADKAGLDRRNLSLLFTLYFGIMGISFAMNSWLPAILTMKGFDGVFAGSCAAIYTVGSFLCSLAVPFLAGRVLLKKALAPAASLLLVGLIAAVMGAGGKSIVYAASLFAGMLVGYLSLYTQYHALGRAPANSPGKFMAVVNSGGNLGAVIAILGVGVLSSNMEQLFFIAAFAIIAAAGGIAYCRGEHAAKKEQARE